VGGISYVFLLSPSFGWRLWINSGMSRSRFGGRLFLFVLGDVWN
jgi:hypothetical protein